jgi:hypothetical protein
MTVTQPGPTQITPDDVESVARKLEEFVKDLPDQERQVLSWIVARAQAVGEQEVTGYLSSQPLFSSSVVSQNRLPGFRTPAGMQVARAAGFSMGGVGTRSITVMTLI